MATTAFGQRTVSPSLVDPIVKAVSQSRLSECAVHEDCEDGSPCTFDFCFNRNCLNVEIPDCVSCAVQVECPDVDLVFVMDTSGSMRDEATALCEGITDVLAEFENQDIVVRPHFLGITQAPAISFTCLTDTVVALLGTEVPGNAEACPFPNHVSSYESWGPATAIVAAEFPWTPGAARVIIPISDEGPCNGSLPEGCNNPGDDRDAIDNAVNVAQANNVRISPIVGTGADGCVIALAELAADGTGGRMLRTKDPASDLGDAIRQIIVENCQTIDACDDRDLCTIGDRCFDGVCTGQRVSDCRPCTSGATCDDNNRCTDDACVNGLCVSTPDFDESEYCCDPKDGSLQRLSDDDPCTLDVCNVNNGGVTHPAGSAGVACDDEDFCTVDDRCDGQGHCVGLGVGTIPCQDDDDCYGRLCDTDKAVCVCGDTPDLCLRAEPGPLSGDGCYEVGTELVVNVELGNSAVTIVGGQFFLNYDPTLLRFVDIFPGAAVDVTSPFSLELLRSINETTGSVFIAVGIVPAGKGTHGPTTMASIRFEPITPCEVSGLCLGNSNPMRTLIIDDRGRPVSFSSCCTGELRFNGSAPRLSCPGDVTANADAGTVSTTVNWSPASAQSDCDGSLETYCEGTNEHGANVDALIQGGGRFPTGVSDFHCTGADSCGASGACDWTVDVRNANTVLVDLQLSPRMTAGSLRRCIEFAFYSNCQEPPVVVQRTVDFGLPFNLPGWANGIELSVPSDSYQCVTARDVKHSLRSNAYLTIVNNHYVARFVGDPALGGNWLVNGNLDGNGIIDSVDQAVVMSEYLRTVSPNSPCGTTGFHADIDGDGVVNVNDLAFVQQNFLRQDTPSCCSVTAESGAGSMFPEISLEDAALMGLGDLSNADLNCNGSIDRQDMRLLIRQERKRMKSDVSRPTDGGKSPGR